jgi:putative hemolysin
MAATNIPAGGRKADVFALRLSAKRLPRSWVEALTGALHGLLGFSRFNAAYRGLPPCSAADFSRMALEQIEVKVELDGFPLDRMPASGPLLMVANHPFGLIEALALDALLLARRPDATAMATYLLAAVPEYADRLIFVDPDSKARRRKLNIQAWRRSLQWLKEGKALLVFPAGRVAGFQWRRMAVADQPWSSHIAAVARKSRATVVPVYFHGHNGPAFQAINVLLPGLQNLLLIRQLMGQFGRTLRATVGQPIAPAELARFAGDESAIEFLREQTERLAG